MNDKEYLKGVYAGCLSAALWGFRAIPETDGGKWYQ